MKYILENNDKASFDLVYVTWVSYDQKKDLVLDMKIMENIDQVN